MTKLEEPEKKLKRYQRRYKKLQRQDRAASARYDNEFHDA